MIDYYHGHKTFHNLYHHEGKCVENMSNTHLNHDWNFLKIFSRILKFGDKIQKS